jgi:DNA modification methylase
VVAAGMRRGESGVPGMRRIGFDEYLEFAEKQREIEVGGSRIRLVPIRVERLHPRIGELGDVSTSVWSFPRRGTWATHRGDYRGNWPPQIARALILMYTEPGDTVLDPMVGSGTTCIEAVLLGRNCIGVDLSYGAAMLTLHRLYWLRRHLEGLRERGEGLEEFIRSLGAAPSSGVTIDDMLGAQTEIYQGDARSLDEVTDESVDLVATHPPYFNIIRYSRKSGEKGDLSATRRLEEYLGMMQEVAQEAYRVLKSGKHIGILVGDTRIRRHYVPITHYVLQVLLKTGFILREEVIKIQHKMKTTREKWGKLRGKDFLLIYHEKLFVLRKPGSREEYRKYRYSSYIDLQGILAQQQ